MLCYVDHHDNAYQWAERRRLETHPKTGAAQLVEVRKTVREVTVPIYAASVQEASPKPPLFAGISESDLLGYGVPAEWLNDVRNANEDSLLELAEHLPSEAAEALLELAVGGTPQVVKPVAAIADPFEHPDAQRRFRLMTNVEELERALEYPWEKWAVFFIRRSGRSWRRTTAARFAWPVPPAQERPSWQSTGPCFSRAPTRTPGSCSPRFRIPWLMFYGRNSGG